MKTFTVTDSRQSHMKIKSGGKEREMEIHGGDEMQVSDGYHTFDELYEHRVRLFIALCKHMHQLLGMESPGQYKIWRSKKHSKPDREGKELPMFEGWFIMGIGTEKGKQISYHLPLKYWEETASIEELEYAPDFDGHTPADVLERLKQL